MKNIKIYGKYKGNYSKNKNIYENVYTIYKYYKKNRMILTNNNKINNKRMKHHVFKKEMKCVLI